MPNLKVYHKKAVFKYTRCITDNDVLICSVWTPSSPAGRAACRYSSEVTCFLSHACIPNSWIYNRVARKWSLAELHCHRNLSRSPHSINRKIDHRVTCLLCRVESCASRRQCTICHQSVVCVTLRWFPWRVALFYVPARLGHSNLLCESRFDL